MLNFVRGLKHRVVRYVVSSVENLGARLIIRHLRGRICSGPFRAVRISGRELFGGKTAKLLGTYELELQTTLEKIERLQPSVALNIGGADGYYAVGMAAAWGVEKVIVFELTAEGRELIAANADLNCIGHQLDIHGVCTEKNLAKTLKSESVELLIMDIEGAELDILEPEVLRELENCVVIVESHDFCRPGCIDELCGRFQDTHVIEVVTSKKRIARNFPYTSFMPAFLKKRLMDEGRPDSMQWLVGFPRSEISTVR